MTPYDGTITSTYADPALIDKIEHESGAIAWLLQDSDPESPRAWGNCTEMVTTSSNYIEPEGNRSGMQGYLRSIVDTFWGQYPIEKIKEILEADPSHHGADDEDRGSEYGEWEDTLAEYGVNTPIAAIDSFSYGDYNEAIGVAIITQDTAEYEKLDDPQATLEAEVKVYQQYVAGEVYGVIITDPEGNEVDSCWGLIGYDDFTAMVVEQFGEEWWKA